MSFFRHLAIMASALPSLSSILGPRPPAVGYRGRRGPARSPGKGIHITPNNSGWWRRHAAIRPMPITERMLMRHGWYRRKLRKQGIAIESNAKNAMVLR